ncbi:DUF4922 domain-containing protein [candidate division KSB1 bacterium]|nr:MAG: DUF4922 domain-containing protein [candidate division KSB1 bacterium]
MSKFIRRGILQSNRIFARYDSSRNPPSLAKLTLELLEQQKAAWPQLAEGYRALDSVRVRELHAEGFTVRLQFNPQRVVSSGAKVDAQSIQARPCFLCEKNLPGQQKGVGYRDDYLVLCNPAPIFAQHYTIAHVQHRPQAIDGSIEILLKLAREFSPQFSVFYNGPRCGASAPDHLHFQACPSQVIPVETQILEPGCSVLAKNLAGVTLHTSQELGREILLLTGADENALTAALARTIKAMKEAVADPDEPMMNIIGTFRDGYYRAIIFPRRKHRPEVYFREGEDRILVSPASVDMGGLIVTPIEKDFLRLDGEQITNIYREVSITPEITQQIIESL